MNKIHVVIPVYNVEKYLEQAVRSVLDQPYKGIDIVLVDDGSPDRSGEICDRLSEESDRVHVIHKENGGLSSARNAGIEYFLCENVSGDDYIAFLDSDDMWVPGAVTEKAVEDNCNCEIVCFSSCKADHVMKKYSGTVYQEERRVEPAFGEIWNAQLTHLGAKFFSVGLIDRRGLRFIHGQQYCEDIMFIYCSVFLANSIGYLSKCLYIYRTNPDGMMGNILKRDPIDHYGRVVDGWLKCDDFLNKFENETERRATAGYSLASVYLLDMARYHYRKHGKKKRIVDVLNNHRHYNGFLTMDIKNVSQSNVRDRDMYLKHHFAFKIKYNVIGTVDSIGRMIVSSKLISPLWKKRKFPFDSIE